MQRNPSFKPNFRGRRAIIATMGLPCTRKSAVAEQIGEWAKCPVLFIDDSIVDGDEAEEEDVAGDWEEAERLQVNVLQRAFTTLCRVANRHLSERFPVVVIKSRLCSTFELRKLMQLVSSNWGGVLLIVECQLRNKHQWHRHFNDNYERKWYRPRSWNDIEKARDDHFDPQARADWDLRLLHLIQRYPDAPVRRLVLDPYNDLDLTKLTDSEDEINPICCHAINYLLSAGPEHEELNGQNPYVVEFDQFRRSRAEQVLNALPSSTTRSDDLCGEQGCLFRYWEQLPAAAGDEGSCCGVCGEGLVSGKPAYTCYYCILTLHQSCAQMIHFNFLNICEDFNTLRWYISESTEKHVPCKACTEKGSAFDMYCSSCRFQTLLKGRLVPLVVNHDHHPHPLSLRLWYKTFVCKACGESDYESSYVCNICEWSYHIQCVFMVGDVKHRHGGHEHVLKLKYSQDDTEEEDYWCDVCYRDLDPYFSFYSCKRCPYYAAHVYCARVYPRVLWGLPYYVDFDG